MTPSRQKWRVQTPMSKRPPFSLSRHSIMALVTLIGTSSAFSALTPQLLPHQLNINHKISSNPSCAVFHRQHRHTSKNSGTSTLFSISGSNDNSPSSRDSTPPTSRNTPKHKNNPKQEEPLLPQSNPNADPHAQSLSGVPHSLVTSGIDSLYPPQELSSRNAKSRKDGYWKFVERGEEPPQQFTYGEFDVEFFGELLDVAWGFYLDGDPRQRIHSDDNYYDDDNGVADVADVAGAVEEESIPWKDKVFCDIGSGTGRLVLAAAALHPGWKVCRGIEILEGIHEDAVNISAQCRLGSSYGLPIPSSSSLSMETNSTQQTIAENGLCLRMAPVNFTCGSFTDPYEYLGDIDCAFVFSSCMKTDLIEQLSIAIGRQCRPGTIIITTEFPLYLRGTVDPVEEDDSIPSGPYEIQLLEKIDGWCWLMGGESTAYVHRVKSSLWDEYDGPRGRPQIPLEEEAFQLVQLMEKGELTDTKAFLRRVYNDMVFHGLPPEWLPELEDE